MRLKDLLRPLLPQGVIDRYRAVAAARMDQAFSGQTPAEVFAAVYQRKLWNAKGTSEFCSGTGSHDDSLIKPYREAVRQFLLDFEQMPDVVDLGCGDFNVGATIRGLCGSYVACDVVPELIEHNRHAFAHLGVDFRRLDVVSDLLPAGDVAFIRQVLQHLSNEQIAAVVSKLHQYKWVVVTEHLPRSARFTPNRDKPIGPGIRLRHQSGVVLTKPPFNLRPVEQRSLCAAVEASGVIQTTAYRLAG